MFRATHIAKASLFFLIIMTIIETTLQHQPQLQQHQNNRTTINNYHHDHHNTIKNNTSKNHDTIHHHNNNKDNLNQGPDSHYDILTNNNHHDHHNTSNSECRPHNSCIKCLSEENAKCFWCAETKQCDTPTPGTATSWSRPTVPSTSGTTTIATYKKSCLLLSLLCWPYSFSCRYACSLTIVTKHDV